MKKALILFMIILFMGALVFPPGYGGYSPRIEAMGSDVAKLVIDPGHGGSDPGASYNLVEKEVALEISLLLEDYLKHNYEVDILMIRESDEYVSLADRCRLANAWGGDFFFSVHSNAGGGQGYEDYINRSPCAETVRIRDEIHPHIAQVWTDAGRRNRGKKQADFHVLRNTEMPAMLVEMGFLDNDEDAELLQDEDFIEKLVRETGEGIASALRLPPLGGVGGPVIDAAEDWTSEAEVPVSISPGCDSEDVFTEYRLLGAINEGWQEYDGEFKIQNEGLTVVLARNVYTSLDIVSDNSVSVVRIDRTGPDEPSLSMSNEEWTSEDVSFSLEDGFDSGEALDFIWDEISSRDFSQGILENMSVNGAGGIMLDRWEESFRGGNSLELGDLSAERSSDAARSGDYGLKAEPETHGQLVRYEQMRRGDDFYLAGWVRTDDSDKTGLTGLSFGVPWDLGIRGYQAVIDVRSGSDDSAGFQLRRDYWHRLDFDEDVEVERDTWYKIEVLWDEQGEITAKLYEEDGSLAAELSAQDDNYDAGFFGVAAYGNSSFDDLEAGRYRNALTDVTIGYTGEHAEGGFHHVLFRAEEDFSGDLRLPAFNNNEGFKNDGRVELASVNNSEDLDIENSDDYKALKDISFDAGQKEITLQNIELKEGAYYVLGHTNGYYRFPDKSRPAGRYMNILKSGHEWGEVGSDPYDRTYGFAEYVFIPDRARGERFSPPVDLSFLGDAGDALNSKISWDAVVPDGSAVKVETSLDGINWYEAGNGGVIEGLNAGGDLTGSQLFLRQTLETAEDFIGPYMQGLQIHITGNPGGSGEVKSQYRIGEDGEWRDYNGDVTVNEEGKTTVYARTIDRVGNAGEVAAAPAMIDRTPPEIELNMKNSDGSVYEEGDVSDFNVNVSAEFTDDISGVNEDSAVYSLDNGDTWQDYTGSFSVAGKGVYDIIVEVSDNTDNTGEAQAKIEIGGYAPGDVNGSGSIDVADAITVLRYVVGLTDLDEEALTRARVSDKNSGPNVNDAILILRHVVGLINDFPVNQP